VSRFYIVNEKRFPLPVQSSPEGSNIACNKDLLPYYRWEHRVTLGYNGKRYLVFLDNLEQSIYVEEFTGSLEEVKDDKLWEALVTFASQKGFLCMLPPLLKNSNERFV
jgi:hypothetical protein